MEEKYCRIDDFNLTYCLIQLHSPHLRFTQGDLGTNGALHVHYTYIHTNIHTYIHTYIQTYIHTYIHTNIHTYIHKYIYTYIHTYIHAYINKYIHTYTHAKFSLDPALGLQVPTVHTP